MWPMGLTLTMTLIFEFSRSNVTLTFDHTHDLDHGFSWSNFEIAVSQNGRADWHWHWTWWRYVFNYCSSLIFSCQVLCTATCHKTVFALTNNSLLWTVCNNDHSLSTKWTLQCWIVFLAGIAGQENDIIRNHGVSSHELIVLSCSTSLKQSAKWQTVCHLWTKWTEYEWSNSSTEFLWSLTKKLTQNTQYSLEKFN